MDGALDIWVGEAHDTPQGNYLVMNLNSEIKFQNFITESATADVNERPSLLLCSVGCAASGADRSANFIGTSSIILPNISLIVPSGP
jgi:hypothetical protein